MAGNNLWDEREEEQSYQRTVALCVAAASLVVLIFLIILYMNNKEKAARNKVVTQTEVETQEDDFMAESHNFTSDELDFWKDAKTDERPKTSDTESQQTPYNMDENSNQNQNEDETVDNSEDNKDESSDKPTDEGDGSLNKDKDTEPENDENHIAINSEDGSKKYYEIMADVPKNDYNLSQALSENNGVLKYKDSRWESVFGIDLSKYNGTVDWPKVKASGVDFAMLRLGYRGYGSGVIELDEKFVEYAQNAQLNGIEIGAYFYSQAINEVEAIEEANYIVGAVGSFGLKFPIAIDVEKVKNDTARADALSLRDRTALVKKFCETVKGYGYKPIIYAERDMLIAGLDLNELKDYDIWLADTNNPTDFPYNFSMWQYSQKGKIDGITGDVDLNISFINYSGR